MKKEYEEISKFLLIAVSFLTIAMCFGYYWVLLKEHNEKTSSAITSLIDNYYKDADGGGILDKEAKFKSIAKILSNAGKPYIIVNIVDNKEIPGFWDNISQKSDPYSSLEKIKKNSNAPLTLKTYMHEKKLYYTTGDLTKKLRFFPVFLFITVVLLVFVTSYLYMFMRKNEKQSLWIAMSKETAHQLGTPLTSLKGWSEYISDLSKEDPDLCELEDGLKEDIEKIDLIVSRFSKISAKKEYHMCNLKRIIEKTTGYILKRMTSDIDQIRIETELDNIPDVYANSILLEWTVENLLKNAIESFPEDKLGKILIKLFCEGDKAVIEISDNGSGIPALNKRNIFETGFSTKKRGWGLGLSLSKKVIEQYHNGSLILKNSSNQGSVFRIELNKYI
ncbi:MAG: HAMP domain-containing sensor histidine kinase [Candidatus Delongbacteria bacterium]